MYAMLRFYRTTKIEDEGMYSMYSIHAGCIAYVNYVFLFSYDQITGTAYFTT